jgi:hypothetical protein
MAVEYRHYLIAKPNYFRPTPHQLAQFITALGQNSWTFTPANAAIAKSKNINGTNGFAKASGYCIKSKAGVTAGAFPPNEDALRECLRNDALLRWPVPPGGIGNLKYPLVPAPADESQDWYWELELHVGANYVYHSSSCIDPFRDKVKCQCGQVVEFSDASGLFDDDRLYRKCPKCLNTINVSELKAEVRNGWTDDTKKIPGGGAYCTALVVDCGKCIPNTTDGAIKLNADLRKLCETIFQCDFYELTDIVS